MTNATNAVPRPTTARVMTWTWIALTAITIASWRLAPAQFTHTVEASAPITALVLLLTLIKVRLIIRNFMEVRTAPRWLKVSTDAWLAALFGSVFVIYLI